MQGELEAQRERGVTYQLALTGHDGIVLASDQCERVVSSNGQFGGTNLLHKISIDRTLQYAWAYAGSEAAPIFSARFSQGLAMLEPGFSERDVLKVFEASAKTAVEEYGPFAKGPWYCSITLACGPTKKIFRHKLGQIAEEMLRGWCVAGQEFNLAAFLPSRYYSPRKSADQLACLAAYSILVAHDLDSAFVDGLDIAIYHDSAKKFEMADSEKYRSKTERIDAEIRRVIRDETET